MVACLGLRLRRCLGLRGLGFRDLGLKVQPDS